MERYAGEQELQGKVFYSHFSNMEISVLSNIAGRCLMIYTKRSRYNLVFRVKNVAR